MASDGTLKFDTSLDTGGLQSGMGKVASVAQQALGVFTGQMMTRAVDALANLGKSALDSVGQLEQNVGGVETLFGDAADAVIASADRAYQTAGMSANDYMSTVTSFSAPLNASSNDTFSVTFMSWPLRGRGWRAPPPNPDRSPKSQSLPKAPSP